MVVWGEDVSSMYINVEILDYISLSVYLEDIEQFSTHT